MDENLSGSGREPKAPAEHSEFLSESEVDFNRPKRI
jgi:hypothetical protein